MTPPLPPLLPPLAPPPLSPVLIVGASARAAAMSAIRAGFQPWAIDLFCDLDLQRLAQVRCCPADQYPQAMVPVAESWDELPNGAPLLITGAMENHLEVIAALARHHPLLGSDLTAIRAARDPNLWRHLPSIPGIEYPWPEKARQLKQGWLRKPRQSGGGTAIHRCNDMPLADETHIVQAFVPGIVISALFGDLSFNPCSDGRLRGTTRQLIGDERLGGDDFLFCGNVAPFPLTADQQHALEQLGQSIIQATGLKSLFGIDLIQSADGTLWPIEINPRYTASVEVLEMLETWPAAAKGIYHAGQNGLTPDLQSFELNQARLADIPAPGTPMRAHQPLCTILAHGQTPDQATARLYQAADELGNRLHCRS